MRNFQLRDIWGPPYEKIIIHSDTEFDSLHPSYIQYNQLMIQIPRFEQNIHWHHLRSRFKAEAQMVPPNNMPKITVQKYFVKGFTA